MAWLVVEGQERGFPCAIRDFDGKGAVLSATGWMGVPDRFVIALEPDGIRLVCNTVSRRGSALKVVFEPRD